MVIAPLCHRPAGLEVSGDMRRSCIPSMQLFLAEPAFPTLISDHARTIVAPRVSHQLGQWLRTLVEVPCVLLKVIGSTKSSVSWIFTQTVSDAMRLLEMVIVWVWKLAEGTDC